MHRRGERIMRSVRIVWTWIAVASGGLLGMNGCGVTPLASPDDLGVSEYLGVAVPAFAGDRAIAVARDATSLESTEATLPVDLVQIAPSDAQMVLSVPDLAVLVEGDPPVTAQVAPHRASVYFRIAAAGEDACASEDVIGPFNLLVNNGSVAVDVDAIPLDPATEAAVRSGAIALCAETWSDFDGVVTIGRVVVEFGQLPRGQDKVEICHVPPGDPDARHTILVAEPAVPTHLANGSYMGTCRGEVEDLELTSACSEDPATQRRWQIHNPNDFDVYVDWEVYEAGQAGAVWAPPGDSYFLTDTVDDPNTIIIRWRNEIGEERSLTEASDGAQCDSALDADGDGVGDAADACPNTPAGEVADANGCSCGQRDADADGVDDCNDACPSTPAGAAVDSTGCPVAGSEDDDGDGVPNASDACSATPSGEAVDAAGCSCSQLDDDDDGVNDCDDLCPGTAGGTPVDGFGCATITVDAGEDIDLGEVAPVTLSATVSGGTSPYVYAWTSDSGWSSSEPSPTVVPLETTTYALTVTDWSVPPQSASDTVTVTIVPRAALQYTIVNLGSPSGNASYPTDINATGQVCGYYYDADWNRRAFLYSDGAMVDPGTLGGAEAHARGMNDAGDVVGESQNGGGTVRAFLYRGGVMTDLGTLGGATSTAYAINNSGVIVGYSDTGSSTQSFLYEGGMSMLGGVSAYAHSGAFDNNDLGAIVGTLIPATGGSRAYRYSEGVLTDLGAPLLDNAQATAINNSGLIAGYAWSGSTYRSFLYKDGAMVDLGTIDGFGNTYAWGIGDSGQVVGNVSTTTGTLSHAFVYTGGQLRDLNDLLVPGHGWEVLTAAYAVNGAGQIAGYGRINGQYRAFVLTPTE
jgi:probable HAF family extracellular repeat protein